MLVTRYRELQTDAINNENTLLQSFVSKLFRKKNRLKILSRTSMGKTWGKNSRGWLHAAEPFVLFHVENCQHGDENINSRDDRPVDSTYNQPTAHPVRLGQGERM